MRSTAQGSFAALLLLVPILAVPMLAIFGVPDFAPVVESPWETAANDAPPAGDDAPPFANAAPLPDEDFTPLPQGHQASVAVWPGQPAESRLDQEQRDRLNNLRQIGFTQPDADQRRMMTASTAEPSAPSPFGQPEPIEAAPPVVRQSPQPPRQPPARNAVMAPAANVGPAALPGAMTSAPLTWQAAVQRLNQMEIRNFRLEPGRTPEQFVFICSYTPRDNPRVSYRFEAEADEPLKAVEKVLAQIDSWLASR